MGFENMTIADLIISIHECYVFAATFANEERMTFGIFSENESSIYRPYGTMGHVAGFSINIMSLKGQINTTKRDKFP